MIVYEVMTMEQLRQLAAPVNWVGVVVDFYADWCGPCQKLKPWFSQLAADPQYSDRILFVKCNTELMEDEMMTRFPIRALPTVVFLDRELMLLDKVTGMNTPAIEAALVRLVESARPPLQQTTAPPSTSMGSDYDQAYSSTIDHYF
jgi:thioredoxin-like negative regulator of GroEL